MVSLRKLYSVTLTYFLKVKKFENLISLKWLTLAQKREARDDFCKFINLTSNGVIAKIILCDLHLLLKVTNLKHQYLGDADTRASAEMHRTTFMDFDICQQMTQLRKLYLMPLTYIFKVTNWNDDVAETELAHKWEMTLNIRYLIKFIFLKYKWSLSCSCKCSSTFTALTVELLLANQQHSKKNNWWTLTTHKCKCFLYFFDDLATIIKKVKWSE